MNNSPDNQIVYLLIDMKKYRLRLSKHMLHQLGNPVYIQLLINPEEKAVAIRFQDHTVSGDQSHKITRLMMQSDNCAEIYSKAFIRKLMEVCPDLDPGHSYRMNGTILYSEKAALFSMKTLICIDNE